MIARSLVLHSFIASLNDDAVKMPTNLEFQFKKYDTNGNGTIDKDELAGLIRGLGLEDMVPSIEDTAIYELQRKQRTRPHAGDPGASPDDMTTLGAKPTGKVKGVKYGAQKLPNARRVSNEIFSKNKLSQQGEREEERQGRWSKNLQDRVFSLQISA